MKGLKIISVIIINVAVLLVMRGEERKGKLRRETGRRRKDTLYLSNAKKPRKLPEK